MFDDAIKGIYNTVFMKDVIEKNKLTDADKYHFEAFDKNTSWEDGTYELIGLHEQGNPYKLDTDILEKHGKRKLTNAPRTYEGFKEYLNNNNIEWIVFYRDNGDLNGKNNFEFSFCAKFNF